MNSWNGIGRITKDVDLKYTSGAEPMAVARMTMAIDDGYGDRKKTNFIPVVVFGKQAENCEKFLSKGKLVGVTGKIQTGSYEKADGTKVYTTDVIAERVDFLEWGDKVQNAPVSDEPTPQGFTAIDEQIPF